MAATQPPAAPVRTWYDKDVNEATNKFGVDLHRGLTTVQAQQQLQVDGPNELVETGVKSPWAILWEQLTQPLVLVLLAAALLSALLGKADSTIAILAIVIINAVLGLVQEYRAERAIAALKQLAAPNVRVRRDGEVKEIPARELVRGDVILLEAGNIVPADARLFEAVNLNVDEASLTGESYPVDKNTQALENQNLPLGDRRNMVYLGTSVSYGRGSAVVVNTGMFTELGRIARLIQEVDEEKTPLARRMDELGRIMMITAFVVMVVAAVINLAAAVLTREQAQTIWNALAAAAPDAALSAVAIAVAVVPEGLPAVVTISLALGTQRMLQRRALIRKLPAVETLGSVTVICSDKTGTLTENRMTVREVELADGPVPVPSQPGSTPFEPGLGLFLLGNALANDSTLHPAQNGSTDYTVTGDPTENAMAVVAARFGLVKPDVETVLPRVGEVPFSSERKLMTTVHQSAGLAQNPMLAAALANVPVALTGGTLAFTKGATERVMDLCHYVWANGSAVPLTDQWRHHFDQATRRMASQGLRVLAVAFRPVEFVPEEEDWSQVESSLTFLGLVGIIDPPRAEVKAAVEVCRIAGVRPVMITGDHPVTALAIARELKIANADANDPITGVELAQMDDTELEKRVLDPANSVYARVSPEHKLRIVRALQNNTQVVAMTGDGVNDAPALKQADIGVAMSITGTDVSKEASDMVLLDDNFATIVSAVEEGRTIYDNIRRFVKYLLASNSGELFVLLMTQVLNLGLPLTTLQILWMNLITDGVPALALGIERGERNSMNRPPVDPNESIFGRGLGRHIVLIGGVLGVSALALGYWAYSTGQTALNGAPAWNTMVFFMLTIAQMGHAYALRSHTETSLRLNPLTNRVLLGAIVVTIILQLMAVYVPFFNTIFGTNPLTATQLALCVGLSVVVFIAAELEKLFIRRGALR